MKHAKYIIVEIRACELPILFHPIISHADVGKGFKVISAGFCEVGAEATEKDDENISVGVWGRSITLKDKDGNYVVSRGEEDPLLIQKMLREQEIW